MDNQLPTSGQNQPAPPPPTSSSLPPSQPVNAPASASGTIAKETVEAKPVDPSETAPIVETREPEKVPEEVESWLEKLERGEDIKLPQPVTDDQGQTLVSSAEPDVTEDQIVLPVSEDSVTTGQKASVSDSVRWLAEWCL